VRKIKADADESFIPSTNPQLDEAEPRQGLGFGTIAYQLKY